MAEARGIMRTTWVVGVVAAFGLVAGLAWAQQAGKGESTSALDISTEVVGGAVGYTPTIATVQDGIVGDVRATVSADRRYVQLDMRPTVSAVISIDNFLVVSD